MLCYYSCSLTLLLQLFLLLLLSQHMLTAPPPHPPPPNQYLEESAVVRLPASMLRDPTQLVDVAIRHGDHIGQMFAQNGICDSVIIDKDMCELFKGRLSLQLYSNIDYYPNRPSANLEDFYSSKLDVLRYLVKRYNYKTYLEIGCFKDENFANMKRIMAESNKIMIIDDLKNLLGSRIVGVDPFSGGTHRMKSDDWFAMNLERGGGIDTNTNKPTGSNMNSNNKSILTFDLVLVDGLHHASQALKDIVNALNLLNEGGTILFHDANPNRFAYQVAPRPEETPLWNGDVWKVMSVLRQMDDIEATVLDIDHGLGMVRRRRNRHRLDTEWRDKIEYSTLDLSETDNDCSNSSSSNGSCKKRFVVRDYTKFRCNLDGIDWGDLFWNRQDLLRLMSLNEMRAWLNSEDDRL